jgi:hypothetical protein
MVEDKEFVDFDTLRTLIEIEDENLFETYLKELYKDLCDRAESSKKQGIGKVTFYDYMKLQVFISEKLFTSMDKDNDGYLSSKEFLDGMMSLYFGSFKETVKVIFNLFDFDKDGQINKGLDAKSPAGDLASATKFMKLLDPTSVVRESELAMAMQATGALDKLYNYANLISTGQKLTPSQREDFRSLAKALRD